MYVLLAPMHESLFAQAQLCVSRCIIIMNCTFNSHYLYPRSKRELVCFIKKCSCCIDYIQSHGDQSESYELLEREGSLNHQ